MSAGVAEPSAAASFNLRNRCAQGSWSRQFEKGAHPRCTRGAVALHPSSFIFLTWRHRPVLFAISLFTATPRRGAGRRERLLFRQTGAAAAKKTILSRNQFNSAVLKCQTNAPASVRCRKVPAVGGAPKPPPAASSRLGPHFASGIRAGVRAKLGAWLQQS